RVRTPTTDYKSVGSRSLSLLRVERNLPMFILNLPEIAKFDLTHASQFVEFWSHFYKEKLTLEQRRESARKAAKAYRDKGGSAHTTCGNEAAKAVHPVESGSTLRHRR